VLISIGSAFAFVSTAVLIGRWLPVEKFSLFYGITQCVGNLSVVAANMFLPQIIASMNGWRQTSMLMAVVGLVIAGLILFVIRSSPAKAASGGANNDDEALSTGAMLKQLLTNKQYWLVIIFAGLFLGTMFNFGANWLISFQNDFDGKNLGQSAQTTSLMFLGFGIGNPVIGALSFKLKHRKHIMMIGALASTILLSILVMGPVFSSSMAGALYFVYGFACSCAVLVYTVIMEILPPRLRGLGIGYCNTVVYVGGAILSTIVAAILGSGSTFMGNLFSIDQRAFTIFCIALLLAFVMSFSIKESFKHE